MSPGDESGRVHRRLLPTFAAVALSADLAHGAGAASVAPPKVITIFPPAKATTITFRAFLANQASGNLRRPWPAHLRPVRHVQGLAVQGRRPQP